MMMRRLGMAFAVMMAFGAYAIHHAAVAADEPAPLKAVFHVDESDSTIHKRVLGNIRNFFDSAEISGRPAFVKIVVNSSGVDMLRRSTSAVADTLSIMEVEYPNLEVVVCQRSLDWRERVEGAPLDVIEMAHYTDSGVLYIADMQSQGWAYIKP